jgi:hypothetical protein
LRYFLLAAVSTLLLLSACAQPPDKPEQVWSKPGASEEEFEAVRYACMREAASLPVTMGSVSYPNYELAADCIKAHGWKLVDKTRLH